MDVKKKSFLKDVSTFNGSHNPKCAHSNLSQLCAVQAMSTNNNNDDNNRLVYMCIISPAPPQTLPPSQATLPIHVCSMPPKETQLKTECC